MQYLTNPVSSLFKRQSLTRWRIVELVLIGLSAVASSLLIVFIPPARVYCGIVLTLSIIFVFRLWRLLPSDRRRVWRESHKLADKILIDRHINTTTTQITQIPTNGDINTTVRPLVAQSMQAAAAAMQFSAISPSQQILMGSAFSPQQQQQAMIAASMLSQQLQQQQQQLQQQSILAASMIPQQLQQALMAASMAPQYQQQQQAMIAASMLSQQLQQQQQALMAASMIPQYQQQQQTLMAASMAPQYQQQQQALMAASMAPQYQQQQQPMMAPISSQSQGNHIASHVSQMMAAGAGGGGNVLPQPFGNVKPTMHFG